MCTVSFIARKNGYSLAMNRDEKSTRAEGLPPKFWKSGGHTVLSPFEPCGGTWIALNDCGVTFALINWYSIADRVKGETVSRGKVVEATGHSTSSDITGSVLEQLPLTQINPFRLIGFFPATRSVIEWRWNLKELVSRNHPWKTQQWISSGFDEPAAQRVRSRTFRLALHDKSAGTLEWLRRLHRSHSPETGPFSTCMHRADAATVSYTEVVVSPHYSQMNYLVGIPCQNPRYHHKRMDLNLYSEKKSLKKNRSLITDSFARSLLDVILQCG